MFEFKTIKFDLTDDGIATITLNRPGKLNAMDAKMRAEFHQLADEIYSHDDIKVVVFTGAGRAFSAGGDIDFLDQNWSTPEFRKETEKFTGFFDALESLEKPVLAAINGPCTGAGLQITLSCDLRIASEEARFGFRENLIGLIPGAGGCSRLVKLIGYGKAKELIFTGEMISAGEAQQIGLINRVVAHDCLMAETQKLAKHLLTRAPVALGLVKRILWNCVNVDMATGRSIEALAQSILIKTEDHKEGIKAFREKRTPKFVGK
ncbi:MAG: enoyl-CoA hydratase/isomerase family protein [bacterium]